MAPRGASPAARRQHPPLAAGGRADAGAPRRPRGHAPRRDLPARTRRARPALLHAHPRRPRPRRAARSAARRHGLMPRRHEQVVSQLLGELVLDVFAAGARLPAEQALAERLGTGRGTVHQALQALEERGMVEIVAGSGAIVRPDDHWRLGEPDVLLAVLEAHRMPGLAAETIRTRTVLESDAAAFACEHATDGDLRLLADRVDGLQ